jgi:hypothetical protein
MTTDNQNLSTTTTEETTYSKASSIGRSTNSKAVEKNSSSLMTLSLRPTKSVKRNNSFKPLKRSK